MKRRCLPSARPVLFGLPIALALAAACRLSAPPPAPSAQPPLGSAAEVRLSTTIPTLAPTATPAPSPSSTPLPIDTPAPTHMPLPTPTPVDTLTPALTPTEQPTVTPLPPSPTPQLSATATAKATPAPAGRTMRVGLDGRNDAAFKEGDYQLIREAKIETLKMMSLTGPAVFARIQKENPGIEFIVRLYDDRMNADGHPTPKEFADRMIPIMRSLQPYAVKFEVGNEPNHFRRYEGWGPTDADAQNFNAWFLEVYGLLKAAHPWAELGYPALATPDSYHRDRAWLALTREAVERADWLGVHCYWQSPPDKPNTMFDEAHGLCFKYYHGLFPAKPLEMTEFDNDNVVWDIPPLTADRIAHEYVTYYQELFKYPYIRSASSFILSSPDMQWDYFAWRTDAGGFKPVVAAVADMARPPLVR
jgi:hypothetical protein